MVTGVGKRKEILLKLLVILLLPFLLIFAIVVDVPGIAFAEDKKRG
jgi:hypothetical protein